MFHSIRWRLILSYTALTLLTVVLVGALALALLGQYARRQADQAFRANAQALAVQARPLLAMRASGWAALEQLVVTTAFMSNVRVRILDAEGRPLVDSDASASNTDSDTVFAMPHTNRRGMMSGQIEGIIIQGEDGTTGIITIQRYPGVFGNRLEFGGQATTDQPTGNSDEQHNMRRPFWEMLFGGSDAAEPLPTSNMAVSVPIGNPTAPVGFVELSGGPDMVAGSLRSVRTSFVVAGIGVGLLAVLVGLIVSRGLTASIRSLGDAARRMGDGDLSARSPVQSSDEIGQVAAQFNRMAAGLQSSFAELEAERDALRRFVADASHELRTPITALKSFNELLTGPAANDPAAQAEFLAESAVQVARLQWITANLLDLSRLDGRLVTLDLAEHNAGDLIDEAAAPFRAIAAERGVDLQIRSPQPPVSLVCDRSRLLMALSNLLDNGLKYGGAGDLLEIGAERAGSSVRLWVRDNGPGIDPAQHAHIFDRFYRGRTRSDDGQEIPGSGLGLSIVASIVQAHGWTIRVESAVGQGARFVIDTVVSER